MVAYNVLDNTLVFIVSGREQKTKLLIQVTGRPQ